MIVRRSLNTYDTYEPQVAILNFSLFIFLIIDGYEALSDVIGYRESI